MITQSEFTGITLSKSDSFELAVEIVVIVVLVNDANVLNAVDEDIGVVVSIEDMIVDQVEVNNVGD